MTLVYVGTTEPYHLPHLLAACLGIQRLDRRAGDFSANRWILDSHGAAQVSKYGSYQTPAPDYAQKINRWSICGHLDAAFQQDWNCSPPAIARTGLTVEAHQERTVANYDEMLPLVTGTYLMPVLQGQTPEDYVRCLQMFGNRIHEGQWVAVGALKQFNNDSDRVRAVLEAILEHLPLKLHGLGVTLTLLQDRGVWECLSTADTTAWSQSAMKHGRDQNHWGEAVKYFCQTLLVDFYHRVSDLPWGKNSFRFVEDYLRQPMRFNIPPEITQEHILQALETIDPDKIPKNRRPTKFALVYKGRHYPPKLVVSKARFYYDGHEHPASAFSGGAQTNQFLKNRGFEIITL